MKGWNPFGKIDMEIGSFLKKSPFNREYVKDDRDLSVSEDNNKNESEENKKNGWGECIRVWKAIIFKAWALANNLI